MQGQLVYVGALNKRLNQHLGGDTQTWSLVAPLTDGRPEPELIELFVDDPFSDWTVHDRYSDGKHISQAMVERHLAGARKASLALQAVQLSNMEEAM